MNDSTTGEFPSFCLTSILQLPHIHLRKLQASGGLSQEHISSISVKRKTTPKQNKNPIQKIPIKNHGTLRQNCSHENSLLHNCHYLIMVGEDFVHLYPCLGQVPCSDAKSQESKTAKRTDLGDTCLSVRC